MSITGQGLRKLCINGVISNMDYWKFKKLKRLTIPKAFWTRKTFILGTFSKVECLSLFRFEAEHIRILQDQLKIPKLCKINFHKSLSCSGLEALCILLRRLAYPNRLFDLVKVFNRDAGSISRIFNWIINKIYLDFGHLLQDLDKKWLKPEKLVQFSDILNSCGSPFPNVVGFIDGTIRPICRPTYNQKDHYSGYKKCHVLKYQSIYFPNGIIGKLDGPFQGRRHDTAILHLSDAISQMEKYFTLGDGTWATLLGDTGYANQKFIKVGFKSHHRLTRNQINFNAELANKRITVEWGFGKLINLFAFLDYKKNLKLYLQPLKKYYIVAALLTNCYVCIYGSQTSTYFNCAAPSLEEYLSD